MVKCSRPDCDNPGTVEITMGFDGLYKKLHMCKQHIDLWKDVWDATPFDTGGITVESPFPDPGKPGRTPNITIETP